MDIFKVNGPLETNYFYFYGEMVIGLGFLRHGEKIQRLTIESKTAGNSLSHAGNATKLPPLASALIAPLSAPAKNRKITCGGLKPEF
jgi:hypothetical protein